MTTYVLQDPEGYRYLPNEFVVAIGRIVVIAGSIEGVAHHLIEVLGVDDARDMSFDSLLERIKKRVRDVGIPECAQWEPEKLKELTRQWCIRAKAAAWERHALLHSYFYFRPHSSEMIVVREHIRPRTEQNMKMSDLEEAQSELEKVNKMGNNLTFLLMHHFEGGGMVSHYVQSVPDQPAPSGWSGDTDYFKWARSIYPRCPYNAGLVAPRPMGEMKFVGDKEPK